MGSAWQLAAAVIGTFGLGFGGAAVLGWRRIATRRGATEQRERLITLAAHAAADDSGRGLLVLLAALDRLGPASSPVVVAWLPRLTARGDAPGLLVTITWDGNQWRRVHQPAAFLKCLEAGLEAAPELAGPRAAALVAEAGRLAADPPA
ncbi:MAG: hypothetical protein VKS61_07990 [Candidatus Sericytochromatia bacterium]|nr:hypothetical protein [Candidatus Sericytochromatia bacterium]